MGKPLRILVTGVGGQLASELVGCRAADVILVAKGLPQLDICDTSAVALSVREAGPDIVVNAAAYTAVDKAEEDRELAYAVNHHGAANVARVTADLGLPVIHVSTDYVYSGTKESPYSEDDETGPTGVYGQSKLDGELAVAEANPRYLIFRTAWLYSVHGQNFVKTMLRLAGERAEIPVVADQFGNPTSAQDLASGILLAAKSVVSQEDFDGYGIYHLAGSGAVSWAGFASEIMAVSSQYGGPAAVIREITTNDYPTLAKRPLNSRLSTDKFHSRFGWRPPEWRISVAPVVRELVGVS